MSQAVQAAINAHRGPFAREVGGCDPRPKMMKFVAHEGLVIELVGLDDAVVEVRLCGIDAGEGSLLRTELTAVDVVRGTADAAFEDWLAAILRAVPQAETDPGWPRFLKRMGRKKRRVR